MSRHAPRRPRWAPTADTMAIAKRNAAKPAPADMAGALQGVQTAFRAMREGVGTQVQWSVLAGSLDVANAIGRQGVVRGLREHLASAHDALQSIWRRALLTRAWHATPLHYYELDALQTFVDLYAYQLGQLGRAEFMRAVDLATGQIRSSGARVTLARDMAGVAA